MKKIIIVFCYILFGLTGYGQSSHNEPVSDSGYYYGVVNDSLSNKYIFMSFLSNDGDNMIHIVPYILNESTNIDTVFMHQNFKESLIIDSDDSIDGNLFVDCGWNVPGFDNYSYYTIEKNIITFSLNIVRINDVFLNVFQFKGKILDNGQIEAIVSSTDSTFSTAPLILTYKNLSE